MAKHQSMRNALNMMMQEKENAQADDGKHKKGQEEEEDNLIT